MRSLPCSSAVFGMRMTAYALMGSAPLWASAEADLPGHQQKLQSWHPTCAPRPHAHLLATADQRSKTKNQHVDLKQA